MPSSQRPFRPSSHAQPPPQQIAEPAERRLHVEAKDISGRRYAVEVPARTTARDLKLCIAAEWQVPLLCLRLLAGAEVLKDAEPLCEHCADDGDILPVTVIVSLEEAHQRLAHSDPVVRKLALKAFAQIAPKGQRGAVAALTKLLNDPVMDVRLAALEAYASLIELSDEKAVASIARQMSDENPDMRLHSMKLLCQLYASKGERAPSSSPGRPELVQAILDRMADQDTRVGRAALAMLPHFAGPEPSTIAALAALTQHKRSDVRIIALAAIAAIAPAGDAVSIDAVRALLEEKDPRIRQQAAAALEKLVPDPAERQMAIILNRLQHGRLQERRAAVKSLCRAGQITHGQVAAAFVTVLQEHERGLRLDVLHALAQRSNVGSSEKIASDLLVAVCGCLSDAHAEVRVAALTVLGKVQRGLACPKAIAKLVPLLEHRDQAIRRDAQAALRQLMQDEMVAKAYEAAVQLVQSQGESAPENRQPRRNHRVAEGSRQEHAVNEVVAAAHAAMAIFSEHGGMIEGLPALPSLMAYTRNADAEVRLKAMQALGQDARAAGNPEAAKAIALLITDSADAVRAEAEQTWVKIARALPEEEACRSLRDLFLSESPEVRKAALRVLAIAVAPGAPRSIEMARKLVSDPVAEVRHQACRTVSHLLAGDSRSAATVMAMDAIEAGRRKLQPTETRGSSLRLGAVGVLNHCASAGLRSPLERPPICMPAA